MEIPNIYRGNYKLTAILPLILIVISLFFIPSIKLGVDFQGGTLLTLSLKEKVDAVALQTNLRADGLDANVKVFDTAVGSKAEIEIPQNPELVKAEELKNKFNTELPAVSTLEVRYNQDKKYEAEYLANKTEIYKTADEMFALAGTPRSQMNISGLNDLQRKFGEAYTKVYKDYQAEVSKTINKHVQSDSISIQTVSPVLSTHFIDKALNVVLWSAILSVILVFFFFRSFVPSLAVLTGAVADVTIAMGAMGLFGIPLTLQSFAALLMLIGFSLDTDILLTTRLLKRKGDLRVNAYDAMKTGITMSIMAIVAFGALFTLAMFTHISVYYEISAVALAGLVGDIFATWGINAPLILYYTEKKGGN